MGKSGKKCDDNVPVGNVRLNETQHLLSSLRHLDKHTVVDLKEAEELKDFPGLGGNVVDTIVTVKKRFCIERKRSHTPGYG